MISGGFPNAINNTTGTIAWPNQALEPVYLWGNSWTQQPNNSNSTYISASSVLAENRDFYRESGSFNGTSGTGSGTMASRPSTCTPGVVYWATDQGGNWNKSNSANDGALFKCTATNTWTLYYTPFEYPHPLRTGGTDPGDPPGPAAPTNVRIVP